jgi:hypothetical protein
MSAFRGILDHQKRRDPAQDGEAVDEIAQPEFQTRIRTKILRIRGLFPLNDLVDVEKVEIPKLIEIHQAIDPIDVFGAPYGS